MSDTLGLLEEAMQVVRDLGYVVREEPLGDMPGGACTVSGHRHLILNVQHPPAERLSVLLDVLAGDVAALDEPMSRLLGEHLAAVRSRAGG